MQDKYLSAIFALGGALIGAFGGIGAQMYESCKSSERHFNSLVYQASIEEWKAINADADKSLNPIERISLEEVLIKNFAFSKALRTLDLDDVDKKTAVSVLEKAVDRWADKLKRK